MTKDEIRMKLWCDVYAVVRSDLWATPEDIEIRANDALEAFDKRFPAESSEPTCQHYDHQWNHDKDGTVTCTGCKETWTEPVDEPRRVWVTFDKNGETISHWESEVEAICDLDLNTITRAYAEFQQVGPMVRSDE